MEDTGVYDTAPPEGEQAPIVKIYSSICLYSDLRFIHSTDGATEAEQNGQRIVGRSQTRQSARPKQRSEAGWLAGWLGPCETGRVSRVESGKATTPCRNDPAEPARRSFRPISSRRGSFCFLLFLFLLGFAKKRRMMKYSMQIGPDPGDEDDDDDGGSVTSFSLGRSSLLRQSRPTDRPFVRPSDRPLASAECFRANFHHVFEVRNMFASYHPPRRASPRLASPLL